MEECNMGKILSKKIFRLNGIFYGFRYFFASVFLFLLAFSILLPSSAMAVAGVPNIINHQGRLLDSTGSLLGGTGTNFCFRFSLYDDTTVGAPDTKEWPTGTPSTMTVSVVTESATLPPAEIHLILIFKKTMRCISILKSPIPQAVHAPE